MDDQYMLGTIYPTAGYLFTEELAVHFMGLQSTGLPAGSFSFGGDSISSMAQQKSKVAFDKSTDPTSRSD
ncbi:hypothetical protein PHYSODRAFT_337233 [Phytophthora sojae]|uniref:Uncharacterized protein n=1 Tax=Phytophthora sojae (strain P6497) TaxID=1094619 RepID=G4ZZX7_PHYSP|nr:hypothetical protein PHYSODRAFT_337233 [Phytophthora sojae]EGZ10419.1 hypothetical protein PHYSODRAFT_337233 [Phytophthora sojae]|eukprot:XP_009533164.1 hypothetical protein PHYSODRAFT_337233 [Phytophthora sojae]